MGHKALKALVRLALALLLVTGAWLIAGARFRIVWSHGKAPPVLITRDVLPGRSARILVIAPHPDDETLGGEPALRAAVRDGIPARVVIMTCGDAFPRAAELAFHHRPTPAVMIRLGQLRQRESLMAMHAIGLSATQVTFLGFPDSGMSALWATHWTPDHPWKSPSTGVSHCPYANVLVSNASYCGEAVLKELMGVIQEFRPTDVYLPHEWDDHPDHAATCLFAMAALSALSGEDGLAPVRVHPYLVHWYANLFPSPRFYRPDDVVDPPDGLRVDHLPWSELRLTPGQVTFRKHIIDLYRSQDALTRPFLEAFARSNVLFGAVPPLRLRETAWAPPGPMIWRGCDTIYALGSHSNAAHVIMEQAVECPAGVALRVGLNAPVSGTTCVVRLHPLFSPGQRPAGMNDAVLRTMPVNITVDAAGRSDLPGVARIDQGREMTILFPYSALHGAHRFYLGVALKHGSRTFATGKWRILDSGDQVPAA